MDPTDTSKLQAEAVKAATLRVEVKSASGVSQEISDGRHTWHADEKQGAGGDDSGPSPYELLLSALGACTSITVTLYAKHKGWPLERLAVKLSHRKVEGEGNLRLDHIERDIEIFGPLSAEQRERLLEIANRCPIHRTLTGKIEIVSKLV